MVELAFSGHGWNPLGSEEFRFGWQSLERLVGKGRIEQTEANDFSALWAHARQSLRQRTDVSDDAHILLLKHPHMLAAPDCLQQLVAALQQAKQQHPAGQHVVQGFDSRQPHSAHPPDYATLRGLERYVARLPSSCLAANLDRTRLMYLCSAKTLRAMQGLDGLAVFDALAAFGHDFSDYHLGKREEVLALIPNTVQKVLDVGGGAGGFLQALKAVRVCETHLAESSEQACLAAQAHVDRVWRGDFLQLNASERFDCITFLDVLEHTQTPAYWLDKAHGLLSPDGCIVASIPNVGHWSVVADLLEGRWDYAPVGIHCITHLRFFTKHSILGLLTHSGLTVDAVVETRVSAPPWWETPNMGGQLDTDRDSLETYAYLVRGRPNPNH